MAAPLFAKRRIGYVLAKEIDADVILATDPDADRMGSVVKNKDGSYSVISGNMAGALLADYVLSAFSKDDIPLMKQAMEKGCDALEYIVDGKIDAAMSKFSH